MRLRPPTGGPVALGAFCALIAAAAQGAPPTVYRGICDASAAAALDDRHVVVASDEDNRLRIYRRGEPDPVGEVSLSAALGIGGKSEADLEGAARVGDRIVWITSHGRNSAGKESPDRQRFLATAIVAGPGAPAVAPPDKVQRRLLADLLDAEPLRGWRLGDAAKLAPEAPGGLNIEGLAAAPGGALWIGFRSPVRDGKALVVMLLDPDGFLAGSKARFVDPVALDLGGGGLRSIERVGDGYLIAAGPAADNGSFAIYRWTGRAGDSPQVVDGIDLQGLRPEALFVWPGSGQVQLLSDDGGVPVGGVACKDLPQPRQSFRALTLPLR